MMKRFWKKLGALFVLLALCATVVSCTSTTPNDPQKPDGENTEPRMKENRVRFSALPNDVPAYDEVEIYLSEEKLPLYSVKVNASQVWRPNNYDRRESGVGFFELDGKVQVIVRVKGELNYASKLRPLSAGIVPVADVENKTLTFELKSAGEYVLEINNDPLRAVHLFVSKYQESERDLSAYSKIIVFEPGVHTKDNSEFIGKDNTVNLSSNTAVFIKDGAVVRAKFNAYRAENILITGNGVIDGSTFDRNATTGSVTVPLDFNYCKNVRLENFACLDPAGWCINFYFTENSIINDIKIISSRSNGDGISLQSCKNIEVDGCFVRSWDDSLVVKNYPEWGDKTRHGRTENIVFKNCTLWTDLAQSMEIGYETVGTKFENVRFENITVLHAFHKPVISIHNANNAIVTDIVFRNITVEDASMGRGDAGNNVELIDIRNVYSSNWSSNHTVTSLGQIENVVVDDIHVLSGRTDFKITVAGCFDERPNYKSEHFVRNVNITNVSVAGQPLTTGSGKLKLNIGGYTSDIAYDPGDASANGAHFLFSTSDAALAEYGDKITVIVIR